MNVDVMHCATTSQKGGVIHFHLRNSDVIILTCFKLLGLQVINRRGTKGYRLKINYEWHTLSTAYKMQ